MFVLEYSLKEYRNSPVLDSLTSKMEALLRKRAHLTLKEANRLDFQSAVYSILKLYLEQVPQMLHRPPGVDEHRYLIFVEKAVSRILAPWFEFKPLETRGGCILIHLRCLLTQQLMQDSQVIEFFPISEPVGKCHEASAIVAIDAFLEVIREMILKDT